MGAKPAEKVQAEKAHLVAERHKLLDWLYGDPVMNLEAYQELERIKNQLKDLENKQKLN